MLAYAPQTLGPDPLERAAELLEAGVRRRQGLARPEFASPEHEAFYDSQAAELLLSGWMGAGKSRILCEKAWSLALEHPGATFGLFRKVAASLPATTARTFWKDVADPAYVTGSNKSESWVEVSAGDARPSRIYFLGLDPDPITGVPSKVGSLDLAWAGVDEAIELSSADWTMLQGRLRDPAMPWHQLAGATNPGSPKHWLKQRFTPADDRHEFLVATQNRFLPPDYLERLRGLPDDVHGKRLGKGLWVAAEGAIYALPDEQIRAADPETIWRRKVGGIDWGFVHAFAAEVVLESGSGRRHVAEELYGSGRLIEDLIPQLLELQEIWELEAWYADPSEPEYIETCRRRGVRIETATNDVGPGIDAVAASITAGMTIDPRCEGLLGEIPDYRWKPDRLTGGLKEEPLKEDDDAVDALRYGVMALERGTRAGKSRSTLPSNKPPVTRRGDLVLIGKRYIDKPARGRLS
jgi:PBSX family phage terminase large subunit